MSFKFNITESKRIKGIWIIKPNMFEDKRGTIMNTLIFKNFSFLMVYAQYIA